LVDNNNSPIATGAAVIAGNIKDIFAVEIVESAEIRIIDNTTLNTLCTIAINPLHGKTLSHRDRRLAFNANDTMIAANSSDGSINIWKTKNGKLVQTLPPHSKHPVSKIVFNHDNKLLAVAYYDGSICLWDLTLNTLLVESPRTKQRIVDRIVDMMFDPVGNTLVVSGKNLKEQKYSFALWNFRDKRRSDLMQWLTKHSLFTLQDALVVRQIYERKRQLKKGLVEIKPEEQERIYQWPPEIQELFKFNLFESPRFS
jgi:WD40 repeat protein